MKRINPLPAMLTLGNFGCGFLSIVLASRSLLEKPDASIPGTSISMDFMAVSCALIFLAMIFDMLDGKVARLTRSSCQFGGELDSLADVVSFGVAPAVIMAVSWIKVEPDATRWWSMVLGCGFVYAACACIRLARYNVTMSMAPKNYFQGLPSPAAGGAVASMVLLVKDQDIYNYLIANLEIPATTINQVMAGYMMLMGLLMVTKVKYIHLSNRLLGGRVRYTYLAAAIFSIFFVINFPKYLLAVGFNLYAIWGLLGAVFTTFRPRQEPGDIEDNDDENDDGDEDANNNFPA